MNKNRRVKISFYYDTIADVADRPKYIRDVRESLLDAIDWSGFDYTRIKALTVKVRKRPKGRK